MAPLVTPGSSAPTLHPSDGLRNNSSSHCPMRASVKESLRRCQPEMSATEAQPGLSFQLSSCSATVCNALFQRSVSLRTLLHLSVTLSLSLSLARSSSSTRSIPQCALPHLLFPAAAPFPPSSCSAFQESLSSGPHFPPLRVRNELRNEFQKSSKLSPEGDPQTEPKRKRQRRWSEAAPSRPKCGL